MHIYESRPITIGKHEWRVVVRPSRMGRYVPGKGLVPGNVTEYQWRRTPWPGLPEDMQEHWKGEEDWPRYNSHDGMYAGLPRTLRTLYDREKAELDRHLYGTAPEPASQLSLFDGLAGD